MKKQINVMSLVILVGVNVLTPISYANEEVLVPESGESSMQTDAPAPEQIDEEGSEVQEPVIEEVVEDLPEAEEGETPSLIDMVVEVVNDYNEEVVAEPDTTQTQELLETSGAENQPLDDLQALDASDEEEFLKVEDVNPDITMTYADTVVMYIDAEWKEFEMGSITISDWTESITMLDRNLWATDTKWEEAYWYHFQWWNNYGFDWIKVPDHAVWQVDASDYGWYHPYSSNIFLKLNSNWDSSNNNYLWWYDMDGDYAMQWPCPAWYHVPSIEEWGNVLKMYHDMNPKWSTIEVWDSWLDDWDEWEWWEPASVWNIITYRVENLAFRKAFQDAFYISLAWFRNNDYQLTNQWSEARFWTSTPDDNDSTKSRRFYVGNSVVDSINSKERVYGYSVRCFQNTDNSDTVTLSFDTRWWSIIQPISWPTGEGGFEPSTPTKQWDKFLWWYLDENLSEPYDKSSPISQNTTFYAKWRSDAVIYEDDATTYTDTLWNVFDMWSITITNWTDSITILDRNLWATDTKWEEAYWYHFQWWNNYGFARYDEINLTGELANASWYNRHNPYVSDKFVVGEEYWDESENDDLWWDVVDEDYARQWPCPDGYHVPTNNEWKDLIDLYSDVWWFTPAVATIGGLDTTEVTAYGLDPMTFREEFQDVFRIPLANRRNYSDGQIQQLWWDARIWASTANSDGIKAGRFYLWWTTVDTSYNQRAYGYSVRCFKNVDDPDNIVLSYEVNWGTAIQAQTLPKWTTWYLPWYTTSKDGDELLGWYSDDKMTIPFDFNTPLTNDTTIYAKWALSYVVTFKDWNWTVLKREVVHQWESATAPANPSRDGYTFKWWDKPVNNITQDVDINAVYEKNDTGWHSSWWGGGWGIHKPDSKWDGPSTDTKDTPATDDNKPEDEHKSAPEKTEPTNTRGNWDPVPPEENTEMRSAYAFSYSKWITTQPTYEEARVDKKLTRIEMAKMLSQYAINVMGSEPDITRYNKFADVSDKLDSDYNDAVTLAYELWIMWINMPNNEFRPNDYVTRWEFATALSRMVYGTSDGQYRQTPKYYTLHVEKLESEKVITQVNPTMMERRWYVMIMLMRLASMF